MTGNADLVAFAEEAAMTALLREYGGFHDAGRRFNAERIAKVIAKPVVEAVIKASSNGRSEP